MTTLPPVPHAIERRDEGVLIEWDTAGHSWLYPARQLRLACPCAACINEMTGEPLLDPTAIPPDVKPRSIALVGAYGVRVGWSDGHDTGIYGFARLLASCGCQRCVGGTGGARQPAIE